MKLAEEWASPVHGAWDLHGVAHHVRQIQADALKWAAGVVSEGAYPVEVEHVILAKAKELESPNG